MPEQILTHFAPYNMTQRWVNSNGEISPITNKIIIGARDWPQEYCDKLQAEIIKWINTANEAEHSLRNELETLALKLSDYGTNVESDLSNVRTRLYAIGPDAPDAQRLARYIEMWTTYLDNLESQFENYVQAKYEQFNSWGSQVEEYISYLRQLLYSHCIENELPTPKLPEQPIPVVGPKLENPPPKEYWPTKDPPQNPQKENPPPKEYWPTDPGKKDDPGKKGDPGKKALYSTMTFIGPELSKELKTAPSPSNTLASYGLALLNGLG